MCSTWTRSTSCWGKSDISFETTGLTFSFDQYDNDDTGLSAAYLELIREELVAFLTPLILHAIVIAEQGSAQYGDKSAVSAASVSEAETDDQSSVTRCHVDMALLLRGTEITLYEPAGNIDNIVEDETDEDGSKHTEADDRSNGTGEVSGKGPDNKGDHGENEDMDSHDRDNDMLETTSHATGGLVQRELDPNLVTYRGHQNEGHRSKVSPPSNVAWSAMDLYIAHQPSAEPSVDDPDLNPHPKVTEEDDTNWDVATTLTDEEDEILDGLMDVMDKTIDEHIENRLWAGKETEYIKPKTGIKNGPVQKVCQSMSIAWDYQVKSADDRLRKRVL